MKETWQEKKSPGHRRSGQSSGPSLWQLHRPETNGPASAHLPHQNSVDENTGFPGPPPTELQVARENIIACLTPVLVAENLCNK